MAFSNYQVLVIIEKPHPCAAKVILYWNGLECSNCLKDGFLIGFISRMSLDKKRDAALVGYHDDNELF